MSKKKVEKKKPAVAQPPVAPEKKAPQTLEEHIHFAIDDELLTLREKYKIDNGSIFALQIIRNQNKQLSFFLRQSQVKASQVNQK